MVKVKFGRGATRWVKCQKCGNYFHYAVECSVAARELQKKIRTGHLLCAECCAKEKKPGKAETGLQQEDKLQSEDNHN